MRVIPDEIWGPLNIWAESRGEPFEGQVAVGFVVRERMRLRYFSDGTVLGTVWRPSQFSWTLASDKQREKVLSIDMDDASHATARRAWDLSGASDVLPPKTVLYHAASVNPRWASSNDVKFVKQIGHHLFYQVK